MLQLALPSPKELFHGFLHLLYPSLCVGCESDLPGSFDCFCLRCRQQLSLTGMHLEADNEFTSRFWGRIPIRSGAALYYFNRRSPIRMALHHLKYKNQPDVGVRIGRRFGELLRTSSALQSLEAIVPVPLHPQKERLRGYNQSAMFARGLSEALHLPVWENALSRTAFSISQTRKRRMERFENVERVFRLKSGKQVAGKHLLLVDDVLTTGATLEACAEALLDAPAVNLSMATIAIATH